MAINKEILGDRAVPAAAAAAAAAAAQTEYWQALEQLPENFSGTRSHGVNLYK